MIVFDLNCANGHGFEGWFGSSADFEKQQKTGMLMCPHCQTANVSKAPMAPAVPRKGNRPPALQQADVASAKSAPGAAHGPPMPPHMARVPESLIRAQAAALSGSTWVGKEFSETARAMHYGERDQAPIHGETTLAEARELLEEGVPVLPLPLPVAPPDQVN